MEIDFVALVPFALINIFSPGPNNLLAASMGMRFGYRRTFPFLVGIFSGFFMVFLACLVIAALLVHILDQIERILSISGALYILYLAYRMFSTRYEVDTSQAQPLHWVDGVVLQVMNPKVMIFALTLFTTFLRGMPIGFPGVLVVPASFALISLSSTSTWAAAGSAIATLMRKPRIARTVNTILALSLVVIAIDLAGLLDLF